MKRQKAVSRCVDDDTGEAGDHPWELPQPIVQHILSFLRANDAARMSLLSKTWYSAWSTHPILNLHLDDYAFGKVVQGRRQDHSRPVMIEEVRQEYMRYACKSLERYEKNNLRLQQLDLCARRGCCGTLRSLSFIKELLGRVEKVGVGTLRVFYTSSMLAPIGCDDDDDINELLPILKAKALAVLTLKWVEPEEKFFKNCDQNCANVSRDQTSFKFFSQDHIRVFLSQRMMIRCCLLRELCVERAFMDDNALQNILSCCPLIETLKLFSCRVAFGTIKLQANNIHNLKEFVISTHTRLSIDVEEAPSLECFDCGRSN